MLRPVAHRLAMKLLYVLLEIEKRDRLWCLFEGGLAFSKWCSLLWNDPSICRSAEPAL